MLIDAGRSHGTADAATATSARCKPGLDAIAALFPDSVDDQHGFIAIFRLFPHARAWSGETNTRSRDIRTSAGGAIRIIAPGGGVSIASDIFGNPLTPPGIGVLVAAPSVQTGDAGLGAAINAATSAATTTQYFAQQQEPFSGQQDDQPTNFRVGVGGYGGGEAQRFLAGRLRLLCPAGGICDKQVPGSCSSGNIALSGHCGAGQTPHWCVFAEG